MKNLAVYILALIVILLCGQRGRAQSDNRKYEVGAQFSVLQVSDPNSLNLNSPDSPQQRTEPGFGGRFTYNLNRHFAFEAEGNFFPRNFRQVVTNFTDGRVIQALFGLKAGIHREKLGFFGKARPGFVSSSNATRARFPG